MSQQGGGASEWARWIVIWVCGLINVANYYLFVFTNTSPIIVVLLVVLSFFPYFASRHQFRQ